MDYEGNKGFLEGGNRGGGRLHRGGGYIEKVHNSTNQYKKG